MTVAPLSRAGGSKAGGAGFRAPGGGLVPLLGPAVTLLTMLFLAPAVAVLVISFTDWELGAPGLSVIGFANFRELGEDAAFRASLANTALYVSIVVPGAVGFGLLIALLIEAGGALRGFYRAAHFLPFMTTLAAMAIVWEALLNPTVGVLSGLSGLFGLPPVNWLQDEATALATLAAIGIWQNAGFAMVLFLAGLKTIPGDLYDAAELDGAGGPLDRTRTVTLPLLGPVFLFAVVVVALNAFQTFDTVQILTKGGPNYATELLLYTMYRESFTYFRAGYGAAVAVIFLAIVIAVTLAQMRVGEKRVHYQ